MGSDTAPSPALAPALVITPEALLQHWQAHRRLTRRVIAAFPDEALFTFSIGGMRPFSALALEMIAMAGPGARGLATGTWTMFDDKSAAPSTKADILRLWDQATEQIDEVWPQIPPQRFQETDTAFGQYPGRVYEFVLYFIDNEIHHRGQGYVYLRSLGIEPPAFYDRS